MLSTFALSSHLEHRNLALRNKNVELCQLRWRILSLACDGFFQLSNSYLRIFADNAREVIVLCMLRPLDFELLPCSSEKSVPCRATIAFVDIVRAPH